MYEINREKFLSTDETKRLLKVCEEMADLDLLKGRMTWPTRFMLVAFALRTGLRVSEISALKIGDIHLAGSEKRLVVRNGKGGRLRDVYFNGAVVKPLRDYLEIKATWGEPTGPEAHLFTHSKGKPFTTDALAYSVKQALLKAGLPAGYSVHSLRHTFATILLRDSGNLRYCQKQLGHSSISMTALYADVLPEQNQILADTLSI